MFRAKARPGNIYFNRPSLGFRILGCVCVRECAKVSRMNIEKAGRESSERTILERVERIQRV